LKTHQEGLVKSEYFLVDDDPRGVSPDRDRAQADARRQIEQHDVRAKARREPADLIGYYEVAARRAAPVRETAAA